MDDNENKQKVTDLTYLEQVSKGDKAFVKEMITLFLSENPEEIKSLQKGIIDRNHELIRTVAHKLRSTIPFLGLDKLIEKDVMKIEVLAAERSPISEIENIFTKIKSICERACWELQPI